MSPCLKLLVFLAPQCGSARAHRRTVARARTVAWEYRRSPCELSSARSGCCSSRARWRSGPGAAVGVRAGLGCGACAEHFLLASRSPRSQKIRAERLCTALPNFEALPGLRKYVEPNMGVPSTRPPLSAPRAAPSAPSLARSRPRPSAPAPGTEPKCAYSESRAAESLFPRA